MDKNEIARKSHNRPLLIGGAQVSVVEGVVGNIALFAKIPCPLLLGDGLVGMREATTIGNSFVK